MGVLAYLLFCAAYWSRQPRVFRRLSRSCNNLLFVNQIWDIWDPNLRFFFIKIMLLFMLKSFFFQILFTYFIGPDFTKIRSSDDFIGLQKFCGDKDYVCFTSLMKKSWNDNSRSSYLIHYHIGSRALNLVKIFHYSWHQSNSSLTLE